MTPSSPDPAGPDHPLTRRQLMRGAVAGGTMLSAGALLAACGGSSGSSVASSSASSTASGPLKRGGALRVGVTGGGASDTIDAHTPTGDTDQARIWQLYEPLAVRGPDFTTIEYLVAESIEPEHGRADVWIAKLRPGVQFHNGKTVDADDVIFSIRRILDPKDPKQGAASIGYVDTAGLRKLDAHTVRIPLKQANVGFPSDIGQAFNGIVPVGYNPHQPVGTGPFKYESFTPGQQSVFTRFENYWQTGKPHVDSVTIIDFADDSARVNALLAGQVDAIDNLPQAQLSTIQANSKLKPLIAETGSWRPITMRVDVAPFNDVRVRQAFRLIVDRPQMVEQVLVGQGSIANDIFGRYDPGYNSSLPQRKQDIDQAKSLLKAAGHDGLTVQFVTSPVFAGANQEAEVFAQQAKAAGVTVNLRNVDSGTFYGSNYLKWPLAQDFWSSRPYLTQVAQSNLTTSPFNETHWNPPAFVTLINQARAELNTAKRNDIIHAAQQMQYEQGGEIIAYWTNTIDAYSAALGGFVPAKSGFNLGNYGFKNVGFLA
jgi:peptide/nickel transport system substrate-binding protein